MITDGVERIAVCREHHHNGRPAAEAVERRPDEGLYNERLPRAAGRYGRAG